MSRKVAVSARSFKCVKITEPHPSDAALLSETFDTETLEKFIKDHRNDPRTVIEIVGE